MKNLSFSIYSIFIGLVLLSTSALQGQQVLIPSGGQAEYSSMSFGQIVYLTHNSTGGAASEGVLQVVCPRVTAPDTIGCPGDTLTRMVPDEGGGTWTVQSSIGTTIDTTGVVTLGFNQGTVQDADTVMYLLNGCTTMVVIQVKPVPIAKAVNGGPYCDGDLGHVYEIGGQGVSWQWTFPGEFSSSKKYAAVSPASAGDYIVVVTGASGCTSTDTTTICVSEVAKNCESAVDVYLNTDGVASFDPATLLGGISAGECTNAGVAPEGVVALSCDDIGGQGPTFTVSDSLGCEETCTTTLTVKDTTNPIDVCEAMQEVVLVWEGKQVFPSSLAVGTDDNCGSDNLEFSFSTDFSAPSRTFDCTEKIDGPVNLDVYIRDASGNVSSCTVTLGYMPGSEDCDCTGDNLTLDGTPVLPADYKASQTIASAGTVASGDSVLYKAVQSITLLPGFTAEAGSFFRARTDDCSTAPAAANPRDAKASDTPHLQTLFGTVFPNPFRDIFTLELDLPADAPVNLILQSLEGRTLRQLLRSEALSAGIHRLTIDAQRLPAGVYVLRVQVGMHSLTQKVVKISQ